jgi:hypothetical protein
MSPVDERICIQEKQFFDGSHVAKVERRDRSLNYKSDSTGYKNKRAESLPLFVTIN